MAEGLAPCPFCGNEHPEIVSGDGVMCGVPDCYGSNMFDQWNRRTPGPATKAMLDWCRKCQDPAVDKLQNPADIMNAFIDEWK
jgi:hypothetical protein